MVAARAHMEPDTSTSELKDSLLRLATQPQDLAKERRKLPDNPNERLDRVLQEIEEIVLPRTLWLEADGKDIASLQVANRRLASISTFGADKQTVFSDTDNVQRLANLITKLSKAVTSLRVTGPDQKRSDQEAGHDAAVSALKTALNDQRVNFDIGGLAVCLDEVSTAKFDWTETTANGTFSGDEAWRAQVETAAEKVNEQSENLGGQVLGYAIPLNDTVALIIARGSGKGICRVAPLSDGLRAIGEWQAGGPQN